MDEFIYLVKKNNTLDNVFLLGKSDLTKSETIKLHGKKDWFECLVSVNDCNLYYDKIYQIFLTKFKLRPDIGEDYFEGKKDKMITIIKEICSKHNIDFTHTRLNYYDKQPEIKTFNTDDNKNTQSRQQKIDEIYLRLNEINIERTELTNEIQRMYTLASPNRKNYSYHLNNADKFQNESNKLIAQLDNEKIKLENELRNLN